jgi:hypothetical protein
MINDKVYGNLDPERAREILKKYISGRIFKWLKKKEILLRNKDVDNMTSWLLSVWRQVFMKDLKSGSNGRNRGY